MDTLSRIYIELKDVFRLICLWLYPRDLRSITLVSRSFSSSLRSDDEFWLFLWKTHLSRQRRPEKNIYTAIWRELRHLEDLPHACYMGHELIVERLLPGYFQRVTIPKNFHLIKISMYFAVKYGHTKIVEEIIFQIERRSLRMWQDMMNLALLIACYYQRDEVVSLLIPHCEEKRIDLVMTYVTTRRPNPAILRMFERMKWIAIRDRCVITVQHLLDIGVKFNPDDHVDLHDAVTVRSEELILLLVEQLNRNLRDKTLAVRILVEGGYARLVRYFFPRSYKLCAMTLEYLVQHNKHDDLDYILSACEKSATTIDTLYHHLNDYIKIWSFSQEMIYVMVRHTLRYYRMTSHTITHAIRQGYNHVVRLIFDMDRADMWRRDARKWARKYSNNELMVYFDDETRQRRLRN